MVLAILHFTLQIYTFFFNKQKYLQLFFNYFIFDKISPKKQQKAKFLPRFLLFIFIFNYKL